MKRSILLFSSLFLLIVLCSCGIGEEDLYGTWYCDEGSTRNVIQFSEQSNGADVYALVVYDLDNDQIKSNSEGRYTAKDDVLCLQTMEGVDLFSLEMALSDDVLTLTSEEKAMKFLKYVLDE